MHSSPASASSSPPSIAYSSSVNFCTFTTSNNNPSRYIVRSFFPHIVKQSNSNAPLDTVLETGWSNNQHPMLRLLSMTLSGTANTSQCGNRGNAHGVAEDDSPQRTSPLHSSFEWSPSSPRAAPARRPSPASASAARWPPDRRLLGVRHTRPPAALTQTRTDRPAHDARLGGQPVTGVRVVLLLRTVSVFCRSPHTLFLSILLADERTRVEAVKCHGDFTVLSSTAGCSSFSVWSSGWNSETALVLGDGEQRHAQAVGTRRSPAGRRDWIGFLRTFSSDHCGRNRTHITSSADPPLT